jgi:DHA2 family lincomycin resistance protein-like MFS transporter
VTVVSTSFQIAGSVGTSLAAGIYGALTAMNIEAGRNEFDSMLTGFHGSIVLVVVLSLIGIVLAILARRAVRAQRSAEAAVDTHSGEPTVATIMKSDVYALSSKNTVLDALQMFSERGISGAPILHADNSLAGFLSDGDVMRYLSATHPSSTSIYSYAVGADDDLEQAMADLADLNVMRLATEEVVTINANESIAEAVATLSDAHLKKVPVLNSETGDMVGIVSRSAINRLAIASYLNTREEQLVTS